jgi:H+/Cl- antiporter ClcA/CBS domain-containing protein
MSEQPAAESASDRDRAIFPRSILGKGLDTSLGMTIVLLSVLIGGMTGLGVILFHYAIEFANNWSDELIVDTPRRWSSISKYWLLPIVPVVGGAIVGLMRWYWQDFGPNMKSMVVAAQTGEKIAPWRGAIKTIAAAVSLGTGASLGPEGPSVEIGANVGMFLGQILHASQERQRLLLGAGAAAGIAAGFNAPIAGVFFALELVLGATFATSTVSVVVLAAVVASLVAQMGLGIKPAFNVPVYQVKSLLELPLYLILGGLASLISIAYTQTVQYSRSAFAGKIPSLGWLGKIPHWLTPILGGLAIGLVALKFPQIKGIGYETIEAILQDVEFSLPLLVSILIIKLLMTALSLGSGLVGGLFAPSMFLGACLGSVYAQGLVLILPSLASQIAAPPAYAMVGMAAVLASSARCPLTAILLMFELTRDYRIVLPLMACVGLSIWAVERMQPKSEPSEKLAQIGVSVQPDRHRELVRQLTVADAIDRDYLKISADLSIVAAGWQLTESNHQSALVVDKLNLPIGMITLHDLIDYLTNSLSQSPLLTVGQISTKNLVYAYIDEPLTVALERMTAKGLHQLPAIDRDRPELAIGILYQDRVSLICNIIATRQALNNYTDSLPSIAIK